MREEPIKFSSVSHALVWAVETASRPNVKSPTFAHLKKSGDARRSDYVDLALTILSKVNAIENALKKHTLKFVYQGGRSRLVSLSNIYAEAAASKPLIYYIALLNAHTLAWHSKEISIYRAERMLACKKGELRKYSAEIISAKEHVNGVVGMAENELYDALKEIGVV